MQLSQGAEKLLCYLRDVSAGVGWCAPQKEVLVAVTEASPRQVSRWTKELEDAGLVVRSRGRRPDGPYSHTMYRVVGS